jgi:hypothetical protein
LIVEPIVVVRLEAVPVVEVEEHAVDPDAEDKPMGITSLMVSMSLIQTTVSQLRSGKR